MNKVSAAFVLGLVFAAPVSIHAEEFDSVKYLTVGAVKVELVDDSGIHSFDALPQPGGAIGGALDEADLILDQIINLGKKIWNVVEANRPVVKVELDSANALPTGTQTWQSLQGWQVPRVKTYRVHYENLYGWDVATFEFRVIYTFGGSINGKGRYLTQVGIVPARLDVSWGYTFNAVANIVNVVNTGTAADPVAGMQIQLNWSVDTVLNHSQSSMNYFVKGDGEFTSLND